MQATSATIMFNGEVYQQYPHHDLYVSTAEPHVFIGVHHGKHNECIVRTLTCSEDGYVRVYAVDDAGDSHMLRVHRVIASLFIHNDDPVNKTVVDHIDGQRDNNSHSNLRWCTIAENNDNKHTFKGEPYTFVYRLPDTCVPFTQCVGRGHRDYVFDPHMYYIDMHSLEVYRYQAGCYRFLEHRYNKQRPYVSMQVPDNGRSYNIYRDYIMQQFA